jgi:sporulation protein YlmC with PRC-barrel domain
MVTHLVVRVKHHRVLDRLVPISLVDEGSGGSGVRLTCSAEAFGRLDAAEEKHQVTDSGGFGYYALHAPAVFPVVGRPEVVTDETVPFGEVDIRRDDTVRASDGEIGHVEGLVIDRASGHVTHVLLQEGHLWGRKQVAIPVETITKVGDGVEVSLSKHQVHALPSIEIEQPNKNE